MAQAATLVTTGTLMQKPIPPRLVEPYLTGRRAVIAGFVYRAADTSFTDPADFYSALDLGYEGSEFSPDMTELFVLRWTASNLESYQVPYSPERGGDWSGKPPFTGTGYTSPTNRRIREFFVDLMPIPVGAEIYRIALGHADFIARYDGQVWLRPAEGV
ncbi:MAG: hypothetical protein LBV34_20695 [Nocardiopsaceae bacterium]|jgi:hypothetical protein|nr:hypothetical protein [Nocardiopsaceae bacterium]